jgi:hypothetical protein
MSRLALWLCRFSAFSDFLNLVVEGRVFFELVLIIYLC